VNKSAAQRGKGQDKTGIVAIVAVAVVAPLVLAVGVLGGIGSFTTVRHLAEPWFGRSAWTVPVGIDLGILALLSWDLLAEYLGLGWPVLRWTAWLFIAATTYLNIAAAHGSATAAIMHAAMPILFVTVTEGIRHLIQQHTGLAAGTRIERIPLSRWLLAPRTTFLLARRMVLWHVTSYRDGLALEYQRLLAVSHLQQDYGRWQWRWHAPLRDRLGLRLTQLDVTAEIVCSTVEEPHNSALAPDTSETLNPQPSKSTVLLIEATAAILANAERDGVDISQAALARQLRERGYRVGNDRLRWLIASARTTLATNAAGTEAA
jgi:uncharacterized protein DUF2637